jgi:hypothetical protein
MRRAGIRANEAADMLTWSAASSADVAYSGVPFHV